MSAWTEFRDSVVTVGTGGLNKVVDGAYNVLTAPYKAMEQMQKEAAAERKRLAAEQKAKEAKLAAEAEAEKKRLNEERKRRLELSVGYAGTVLTGPKQNMPTLLGDV